MMYPEVHAVSHRLTASLLLERVRPGEWVLDVGAGDRDLASRLESRGLRVIAVDPLPSKGLVGAAWENLPVRSGSLAGVVACASLQYAVDPGSAVLAAAEALRPGGRVVVAMSPVHASELGARGGQATARQRTGNPDYRHFSQHGVEKMFERAGLAVTTRPFKLPGAVGLKRRAKVALGVNLASFPTFIGDKRRA